MSAEVDPRTIEQVAAMAAVYRMYDQAGRLLYIGSSANISSRLTDHADKRWYPLVATIRLEWFPDRKSAAAAESAAIRRERPQINIMGIPNAARRGRGALIPVSSPATLAEAIGMRVLRCSLDAARKAAQRPGFPSSVGDRHGAKVYDVGELVSWQARKARTR